MSSPQQTQQIRSQLQAIVKDLDHLAQTYEPPAPGAWGIEDPLIIKAKALIATAQTPIDHATSLVVASLETTAIRTLLELGAIQAIPETGSISLSDLAIATHASAPLLERLLRVVTSSNFINQDPQNGNLSHSPLSLGYSTPSSFASNLLSFIYDEGLGALIPLPTYLSTHKTPSGHFEEPGATHDSTRHNLETYRAGLEGQTTAFEIMEADPIRMERFQKTMGIGEHLNPFVGYYDFSALACPEDPERKVFVDVGGGHGLALTAILAAHPQLKASQCVLQDTAKVIAFARSNTSIPSGVQFQAHDFFQPQPVKGAKAYYLKAIAHDLSDANLIKVLKNITAVMAKDSKVLIAENVLPETEVQGIVALMDLMMMVIGGKERTEAGFRRVLDQAGLKVDGVHRAEGKRSYAIVEASLK